MRRVYDDDIASSPVTYNSAPIAQGISNIPSNNFQRIRIWSKDDSVLFNLYIQMSYRFKDNMEGKRHKRK